MKPTKKSVIMPMIECSNNFVCSSCEVKMSLLSCSSTWQISATLAAKCGSFVMASMGSTDILAFVRTDLTAAGFSRKKTQCAGIDRAAYKVPRTEPNVDR